VRFELVSQHTFPALNFNMIVARTTRRDFLTDVARSRAAGALALQLPMLTLPARCARDTERFTDADRATFIA
jgi:hypothetical protein